MINHVRSIDLAIGPHAKSERAALREDAIRIAIMRDAIYFRNSHVKIDELPNMIRDATLNGAEKKIYLPVDARARYRDVAQVLPQIQLTGVEKVCFPTD
jgi:biopolymer transport protein ExbD